jgi:monoamine oxidase
MHPRLSSSTLSPSRDRRGFLKTLAAGALPLVGGALRAAAPGTRVAVVGAGMAGLAAVDRLSKAGVETVLIEARDRIGGRVWTAAPGIDLGASWIHGPVGNPLVALADAVGAKRVPFNWNRYEFYEDGDLLPPAEAREIDQLYSRLEAHLRREGRRAGNGAALSRGVTSFSRELSGTERQLLGHIVNSYMTHEYGADPGRLSLGWYDEGANLRGTDQLVPSGYAGLFEALQAADEVHLSRPVNTIRHSTAGVVLETDAGDFTADAAIVTIPLGVLKRGTPVFDPPLAGGHALAIQRLGMGTLNKIHLRFPRVAWPRQVHAFGRIDRSRLWAEWVNFVPINGQPALMGFNAGSLAERLEQKSDSAILASAMDALRGTFGRSFPSPVDVHITRWHSDPWSRGAYSSLAPGSTPRDRRSLAAPVHERLLLAGEACSVESPAMVHGAYRSGVGAADYLLATLP